MYSSHMNRMPMQPANHQLLPNDPTPMGNPGMHGPGSLSQSPLQYGMPPDNIRPPSVGVLDPQQQHQQQLQQHPMGGSQMSAQPSATDAASSLRQLQQQAQEEEIFAKEQMIAQSQDLSDFEKQAYLKSLRYYRQQQQQKAAKKKLSSLPVGDIMNEVSQVWGPTEINVHPSHLDQYGELPKQDFPEVLPQNPKVTAVKTDRAGAQQFASRPNLVSIPKAQNSGNESSTQQYHQSQTQQAYYPVVTEGQQDVLSQQAGQKTNEVVEEYHTSKSAEKQRGVPVVGKMKAVPKKGQTDAKSVSSEQGDGSSGVASRKPVQVVRTEHPNYVALSIVYDDTPKTEAKPKVKKTPLDQTQDDKESWQYCELCKIRFSHKKHYEVHCSGMLHVQKKNEAKNLENQIAKVFDDKPGNIVTPVTYKRVEKAIKKTTGLTSKMVAGGKSDDKQGGIGVDSSSDCELIEDETDEKNKVKSSQHSCKLCNIDRFISSTSFQTHMSSHQHRQKYLQKQSELGFDKFFEVYGKLPYTCSMDVTSRGSDTMSHMDLMVYRSGMLNKLECRVCGIKCGVMASWKQHVGGKKHTRKCAEEFHSYGRVTYISMYGDIPIPERAKFHSFVDTLEKELGNKPKKLAPHSSQSAAKQPTAGKPEEEKPKPMGEVQQIQNLAKTTQYQKEQVDEKSTKEKEEEEKARKLTEEKMKRIKQMDEQIKQVKEELEAKSRLNSAVLQQHRSLVQLNALNATTPVPPGMIQPSPVVMLSDHQAIAAARAKAQAQGLLPQSLQMPLTEQIQLLSSTVPQQISVKPTSNVAELHSQLQKQLLGAEIVPVSKPVEQIPTSSVDVQRPVEIRQQPTVDISQQMASILQHQAPVSIGQHHFVGVRQQPTDVTLQSAQVVPQGSQMPPQITGHSDPAVIQPEGRLSVPSVDVQGSHPVYDYGHGDKPVEKRAEPRVPPRREENYSTQPVADWKESSVGHPHRSITADSKLSHSPEQNQRYSRSDFDNQSDLQKNSSNIKKEWEKKKHDLASWDAPPRRQDLFKEEASRKSNTPETDVRGDRRMQSRRIPDKDMERGHSRSPRRHTSRDNSMDRSDWRRSKDEYYDRKERDVDRKARETHSSLRRREESPDYRKKERHNDRRDSRERSTKDDEKHRVRKQSPEWMVRKDKVYQKDNDGPARRPSDRFRSRDRSRSRSRSYERPQERKREDRRDKDKNETKRKDSYDREDKGGIYDRDRLKEIKIHKVIGDGEDKRDLREILDESRKKRSVSPSDLRSKIGHKKPTDIMKPQEKKDNSVPADKSIVVEVARTRSKDTNYRKVYVPGSNDPVDEDLRLQIEKKHKDRMDQYEMTWKYEAEWRKRLAEETDRQGRDRQWKESERRPEYYPDSHEYSAKEYDSKHKTSGSTERYDADRGAERAYIASGTDALDDRKRLEGKYGRDDEYYQGYSSTHSHREQEMRDLYTQPNISSSRSHGEGSRKDEWSEDRGKGKYREDSREYRRELKEGVALTKAVEIFTETLQQFLSMLHDKEDHHGHSGKDPLAGMTREEVDAVLQVQQMTGIADISIAAKAMHVFSQMDPVMIQTIGMLGPDTIQELTSGNPDALKRIPNYEEIVDGILKGKINPHKMQDTMQKYGFGSRSSYTSDREEKRSSGYSERQSKRSYTGSEEYLKKKSRY